MQIQPVNPRARFLGIDLDERCAKMCALNLILRELSGRVYCGNTLTGEMYTAWDVTNGWVTRDDKPEPMTPKRKDVAQQLTLLCRVGPGNFTPSLSQNRT